MVIVVVAEDANDLDRDWRRPWHDTSVAALACVVMVARLIPPPLVAGVRGLGAPLRRIATTRSPAVADPQALAPGDPPPTGGRTLILYDGACGVCLHGRDLIARLDRRDRLAHDELQRHVQGLLGDLSTEQILASWHVIHPDGRRETQGRAVLAIIGALPGGRVTAPLLRPALPVIDRAYRWFSAHRGQISPALALEGHPQRRDPERPAPEGHRRVQPTGDRQR